MIAVLHTWGQTLTHHPHVHCVVPGGGLTADGRWADAYAGFNRLYDADRKPGPITEASCWAHGRRKFFELADVTAKPFPDHLPRERVVIAFGRIRNGAGRKWHLGRTSGLPPSASWRSGRR
jgi:hypothetical protein